MTDLDAASLSITAILILDQDGKRILGKYYDKQTFPMAKERAAFEKNLFQKTHKANAEIILLDGLICVYRSNVDLFFYVVGSAHENELILQSVLNYLYDAILHGNVEKICDDGVILETDAQAVVARCTVKSDLISSYRDQQHQQQKKGLNKKQKADDNIEAKRASKGRRIRYVEIPKLVNFFPAKPEKTPWSNQRRDELFNSLFT